MRYSVVRIRLFLALLLLMMVFLAAGAYAQEGTAEATPEATESAAPTEVYTIPADPEGINLDEVIARVGEEEITLGEVRTRIRYERFYYFFVIEQLVNQYGPTVLDPADPANFLASFLQRLVGTLVDPERFADQILATMISEKLYHQEAVARGVQPEQCDVDRYWSVLLNFEEQFVDCQFPEGFAEGQQIFFDRAAAYSGITPEAVQNIILNRAEFDLMVEVIGQELELDDVQYARSRHIRVADEATAAQVLERLNAGKSFDAVLVELTQDTGAGGNRGDLGMLPQEALAPELVAAAAVAPIGEVQGPLLVGAEYQVFEVLDKAYQIRARHILFETEDDAQTAIDLLDRGADFAEIARQYSVDTGSGIRGGDLGFFSPGQMVAEFSDAAFGAEIGQVVGPVQTQFGFHIIEVTEKGQDPVSLHLRHIVVASQEEGQAVVERLSAGEDFGDLAAELSLDPTAAGHRGDTGQLLSSARQAGFYTAAEVLEPVAEAVFAAQPGDLVGPIVLASGVYVIEVQEFSMLPPRETQSQSLRDNYVQDWEVEQFESDRVFREEVWRWRDYVPQDPTGAGVNETLLGLDQLLAQSQELYEQDQAANTIPNILSDLEAPEAPEGE